MGLLAGPYYTQTGSCGWHSKPSSEELGSLKKQNPKLVKSLFVFMCYGTFCWADYRVHGVRGSRKAIDSFGYSGFGFGLCPRFLMVTASKADFGELDRQLDVRRPAVS